MPRVHVSLPHDGPGAEVLRGALRAAEGAAVDLVVRDAPRGYGAQATAASLANALAAAADPEALAYLGDFHSIQVDASAPVLGAAGLLAVAPAATWAELRGTTLVRLMPDDRAIAQRLAEWLAAQGVADLLVVHDHDDGYGVPVGEMCAAAALALGLAVRRRPVWGAEETMNLGTHGAVVYVGVPGSGAVRLWRDLHAALPEAWLVGMEGLVDDGFAGHLDPGPASRTRAFQARCTGWDRYGEEAMRLILDAIASAGDDRAAVAAAASATRERDSAIGRYSLDAQGLTTSGAYGIMGVRAGRFELV